MDLSTCTWMVRELGEAVSCTVLLEDGSLLVGGWDGKIKYWSGEGDLIWECQTPNRVSSMTVNDRSVYVTAGLHLVSIATDSGEQRWSVALEGSADAVVATSKCVLASSSVYDIEHNDFIESAIWIVSFEGNVLNTHRIDERPWTLNLFKKGVIAGLGRPINGYIILNERGDIKKQEMDWESPTICATDGNHPIFGLADGSIRSIDGTVMKVMDYSVSNIVEYEGEYLIADDRGRLECFDKSVRWEAKGSGIVALSSGFAINENGSCWVARWNGSEGALSVHSMKDGSQLASLQGYRIHDFASNGNRFATGCENGQVFVWDKDLLQRRIEQPSQQKTDVNRNAMFEKLRALRK